MVFLAMAIAIAVMTGVTQQVTMAQTGKTFEGDNNHNQPNCDLHCTVTSSYENTIYGIRLRYPSDWSVQEYSSSGQLINVGAFFSPTGNPFPTATVVIYLDRLHNSTTSLNSYAHFVAFTDYENRPSYFHAFKLLEFSTNSTLAGKTAYTIIGTYDLPSSGLQKLMEIGTIIGDKAYSLQYIVDAPKYLPAVRNMRMEKRGL